MKAKENLPSQENNHDFVWLCRVKDLSSIVGALTFFALNLLLVSVYGNHALWLAQLSYLAVRGIVLTIAWSHKTELFERTIKPME